MIRAAASEDRTYSVRRSSGTAAEVELGMVNDAFRTPTDAATWAWYLEGNPHGHSRVYLVVNDQTQQPAGLFAFTPVQLRVNGRPVAGSSGHHLLITPENRGGAAFIALSRGALDGETASGVELALGLPNALSYQPQRVFLGWRDLCRLECWYKLSPAAVRHHCIASHNFGAAFDAFYDRIATRLSFCVQKDATWLNWRFHQRPGNLYTVYIVGSASSPEGYIVLKRWREPDGYTKAHIVDLHALDAAALDELLRAADAYAEGCGEINLWMAPGCPYGAQMRQQGFVPRASASQPLIAKPLAASMSESAGPIAFSYADGDYVY